MSIDSEFHREFGTCCSRKFEGLSVRQHARRAAIMGLIFLGTLTYLYLIFVVKFFDQYATNDVFNLLQSLVTFASVAVLAISSCRLVHSVKAIATELTAKVEEPLDTNNQGN